MSQKLYTRRVATNMVIANMIGTGIFTSIGFQVSQDSIPDPFSILMIWLIGGIFSLCGATAYGEVATTFRESGGEYTFLSKIYHPVIGLASGWVSLIVGFSAAIASLALASGEYLKPVFKNYISHDYLYLGPKLIGVFLILLVTLIQLKGVKSSGRFQNIVTYIKLSFIVIVIVSPFLFLDDSLKSNISFLPTDKSWGIITSLPFAGALVFVMFAYSGWNASAYIAGNLENPRKNLPYSLIVGTCIVTLIYLVLTFVFMYVCSFEVLEGKVDIGNLVIERIFNSKIAYVFGFFFALALISGINAMFIAGPRVAQKIGSDYKMFRFLEGQSANGAPRNAILLQTIVSLILVIFSSFKGIVEYIGLTLSIFSLLTVFGVFIFRFKKIETSHTVKTWGYPFTPLIFVGVTSWMICYFVIDNPMRLFWSLLTILPAFFIYYYSKKKGE